MNQSMTRIARALSSDLEGSRRAPTRQTAMSLLHSRSTAATSLFSIAANRRSATSTMVCAVVAGMGWLLVWLLVSRVGNGQPAPHQCAQAGGDLVGAPVHLAGPDRGGERILVGETQAGQRRAGFRLAFVEQFALDDAQRVGGHPGVEVDLSAGRLADIGFEEFRHRGDELGRERAAVRADHPPSSDRPLVPLAAAR